MKFLTYVTHSERYYPALIQSFEKYHCDYDIVGFGSKWIDYLGKLEGLADHIRSLENQNEVVCVMDGFDTVVTGEAHELERRFIESEKDIVYSVDTLDRITYYLFWKNKSRLNAGIFIGFAHSLLELLDPMISDARTKKDKFFNDQVTVGRLLQSLRGPRATKWVVDLNNEFFLNLSPSSKEHVQLEQFKNHKPMCVGAPAYQTMTYILEEIGIPFRLDEKLNPNSSIFERWARGEFTHITTSSIRILMSVFVFASLIILPILAVSNLSFKKREKARDQHLLEWQNRTPDTPQWPIEVHNDYGEQLDISLID